MPDQGTDQGMQTPAADQEKWPPGDRRGRSEGSKRTWFKPGVSGNPKGRPRGIRSRKTPWALLECRRVLDQPAEQDSTDMQRMFRKLLTEKPGEFFDVMCRMEEVARRWYD